MKRLAVFLGGLLILPAFGEVAPIFYDEYDMEYADSADPEFVDEDVDVVAEDMQTAEKPAKTPVKVSRQQAVSRNIANRSSASRAAPSNASSTTSSRGKSAGNSSRAVAARTTTAASPRTTTSRNVASRTATTGATRAAATRATGGATRTATTTRTGTVAGTTVKTTSGARSGTAASTGARVSRAARTNGKVTAVTGNGTTDGSASLYNSFENSSRVGVRASSSLRRSPVIRVASMGGISTENATVASDTSEMDELAELTDYCKAQYTACMDNYCNVLDENQGRCSCSANIKNYAKAEAALKQATEELQDVAQKIQYIGLTAREVETLFSQTEAELKMQSTTDSSQIKTSLDKIKDMIIEVKSGNATSTASSGLNFDVSGLLDFSIDSTGFDISSFLGGLSGGGNASNQRGEELFKTATNRCKANVLKACTAQGVDAALITNSYDLEIDKECIAYEKSLNESNDQMVATVRNAQGVLQKARLMVAQSKNEYDMRGCINALDSCMQDEFVCGSDYENCLDPTGRYIVNGEIVVGSQPGHAIDPGQQQSSVLTSDVCKVNLYRTWDFPDATCQSADVYSSPSNQYNAWGAGANDTLAEYIEKTVKTGAAEKNSVNMSKYLQNKIGYVNGDKNFGMCVGVLNKCQDYTYTGRGTNAKYNQENDVIKQYLARVLVQIKAKQDEVLSEYAESCITDVSSCLAQNGYPTEEPAEWNGSNSQMQANIAINACRSTIVTCMSVNGYSIDTPTPGEMNCWVMGLQFNTTTSDCSTNTGGGGNGDDTNTCSTTNLGACTQATCSNLGANYAWCDRACRLASECSVVTYTHTITYKCGTGATGSNWTQQATGQSGGVQITWDNASSVNSHCSYPNYTATNWNCVQEGYTSGRDENFGASATIRSNVTCTVVWTANAGNHECSPSNRAYCTDKTSCETTGQGAWCYATSTATAPSCVAGESACKCNALDSAHCTSGTQCTNLGKNYYYCATSASSGAACGISNSGCCYTTGTVSSACNEKVICELVGNTWCATENRCMSSAENCNGVTPGPDDRKGASDYVTITLSDNGDSGNSNASSPRYIYWDKNGVCDGWSSNYTNSGCGPEITELSRTPTKSGYTYGGHWTAENCGGNQYISDAGFLLTPRVAPTKDMTIYACWQTRDVPTTYTITYNCNGGTGSVASQTVTSGAAVTLQPNACTYDGYIFNGWDCGTYGVQAPGSSITPAGDVKCSADWKAERDGYTWDYIDVGGN